MDVILRNILLGISLAAPIGPATLAVIQTGLRQGFLRAFLTGLGITAADATYLLVVFFGLSGLMTIPLVKVGLWIFGALVLLYLGVQSLREARRSIDLERSRLPADRNPLLVGYLVNISNPLAVIFWVGIFGSLLSATAGQTTRMEALLSSSAILVGILFWHTTLSFLTHYGKRLLNEKTARYITGAAGIALLFFALRLAYSAAASLVEGW
jgi:threonine/homoserine/homoserine lactone efflux protein